MRLLLRQRRLGRHERGNFYVRGFDLEKLIEVSPSLRSFKDVLIISRLRHSPLLYYHYHGLHLFRLNRLVLL
jgi:hypothetical protein